MLPVKLDTVSTKNSATRNRILQAACELLERGDSDVSMHDIARHSGLSRQTVYIQFGSRAELLIAATRFVDERFGIEQRLAKSREAKSGIERLSAYIEFWGNYLPHIHGLASAFLDMRASDEAAAAAWNDRMTAHRHGCRAVIQSLISDDVLANEWNLESATRMLMMLLSFRNWEHLRNEEHYSSAEYIEGMTLMAHSAFLRPGAGASR